MLPALTPPRSSPTAPNRSINPALKHPHPLHPLWHRTYGAFLRSRRSAATLGAPRADGVARIASSAAGVVTATSTH
eukprot:3302728-Prymnesium_polylepis.1